MMEFPQARARVHANGDQVQFWFEMNRNLGVECARRATVRALDRLARLAPTRMVPIDRLVLHGTRPRQTAPHLCMQTTLRILEASEVGEQSLIDILQKK